MKWIAPLIIAVALIAPDVLAQSYTTAGSEPAGNWDRFVDWLYVPVAEISSWRAFWLIFGAVWFARMTSSG